MVTMFNPPAWLWDWFTHPMDSLAEILKALVFWLFDLLLALIQPLFDGILAVVASALDSTGCLTALNGALATLQPFYAAVNAWVPIGYAFVLISAYLTFVVAFIIFKLVKRTIPAQS
jgi:hypothetical protein